MDPTSTGDDEANPQVEYTAQASSPIVNGEVTIKIGSTSFTASAVFDTAEILFANINSIEFSNYVITVMADDGDFVFSRMGQWAQPFYDELCVAYNKMVRRAFFVTGKPILTAKGDYCFAEDVTVSGKAPVEVY
jgi:hypothetical protein